MPSCKSTEAENVVRRLSGEGMSYRKVAARAKELGVEVSKSTVANIVNNHGMKRSAAANGMEFKRKQGSALKLKNQEINKIVRSLKKQNPPTLKSLGIKYGVHRTTIGNYARKNGLVLKKKTKVNLLPPGAKSKRKTRCRKLYEKYLSGKRSEYAVTLDEAWVYLNQSGGHRDVCWIERGRGEDFEKALLEQGKLFEKKIMVVAVFCARGPVMCKIVPNNTKINADYYINSVLKPLFENELPRVYGGELDKVFFHHDGAPSHTAKKTTEYLENVHNSIGINYIKKDEIPPYSPDVSPLDFFGFGLLKHQLKLRRPRTIDGLGKIACEVWMKVEPEICNVAIEGWKRRLRLVAKRSGSHIEHIKSLHDRCIYSCGQLPKWGREGGYLKILHVAFIYGENTVFGV